MKIIERKGDIARNEQCLLFPLCFSLYRIDKLSAILRSSEIVDGKLFLFERVKNFCLAMVNCLYDYGPDKALELLHGFEPLTFKLTRFYCTQFDHIFCIPKLLSFQLYVPVCTKNIIWGVNAIYIEKSRPIFKFLLHRYSF